MRARIGKLKRKEKKKCSRYFRRGTFLNRSRRRNRTRNVLNFRLGARGILTRGFQRGAHFCCIYARKRVHSPYIIMLTVTAAVYLRVIKLQFTDVNHKARGEIIVYVKTMSVNRPQPRRRLLKLISAYK